MAMIADGEPIWKIGEAYGLSRRSVQKWRDAGGEERRARWDAALRDSAHAHAEAAERILAEGRNPENTAQAQMTKALADLRWKLASVRDRAAYGDTPAAVNVNLDIGQLHLDALRRHGHMELLSKPEPLVLEGRTVDDDADGNS